MILPISIIIAVLNIVAYISNSTVNGTIDFTGGNSTIGELFKIGKLQPSEIPTNISVVPNSLDKGFLILSAISINDTLIQYTRDLNDEILPFQLTSWNQSLQFSPNYEDPSQEQNLTLTNLLIGHIGNFSNFENLLREAKWYKDLLTRLNLTIELPNDSVSFMLAEVELSNNISGIYYGNFDGNQNADKYQDDSSINSDLQFRDLKTGSISQLKTDDSLYNVTHKLVCNDLTKFSYDTCK